MDRYSEQFIAIHGVIDDSFALHVCEVGWLAIKKN